MVRATCEAKEEIQENKVDSKMPRPDEKTTQFRRSLTHTDIQFCILITTSKDRFGYTVYIYFFAGALHAIVGL